tara:strand:- start:139 stop:681 length:543 start_codon:yes stop_codon:yes gene_type:complete
MTKQRYFFSDLDGTLIKEDMLFLSLKALLKESPIKCFLVLLKFWRGLPWVKDKIATNIDFRKLDFSINKKVLSLIQQKKAEGYICILISGSNQNLVKEVFKRTNIFNNYFGSDNRVNLVGLNKLKKINQLSSDFEYIGNSKQDIAIWEHADIAYVYNSSEKFNKRVVSLLPKHKKIKIVK